jgi:FkbM family methyltransferase
LRRSPLSGFWKIINYAYYDPKKIILSLENFDYIAVDGCLFYFNDQVFDIQRVKGNPWLKGIRLEDTVLDIGANIGAISIPLAKVARRVFAVEPIFADLLRKNVELNRLDNLKILKYAMGEGTGTGQFTYMQHEGHAPFKTFAQLKEMCGQKIDFLKCDCEGAEWTIQPQECDGIRELRFEFHIRRRYQKEDWQAMKRWYQWLDLNGYQKQVSEAKRFIFARDRFIKSYWLVCATKKEA